MIIDFFSLVFYAVWLMFTDIKMLLDDNVSFFSDKLVSIS